MVFMLRYGTSLTHIQHRPESPSESGVIECRAFKPGNGLIHGQQFDTLGEALAAARVETVVGLAGGGLCRQCAASADAALGKRQRGKSKRERKGRGVRRG